MILMLICIIIIFIIKIIKIIIEIQIDKIIKKNKYYNNDNCDYSFDEEENFNEKFFMNQNNIII